MRSLSDSAGIIHTSFPTAWELVPDRASGVDTHSAVHYVAAVYSMGLLGVTEFPASAKGYEELLNWLGRQGVVVDRDFETNTVWSATCDGHPIASASM